MTTELGPLPKFQPPETGWDAALLVYTADQMAAERERCYGLGVAAERERCAMIADHAYSGDGPAATAARLVAARIRA